MTECKKCHGYGILRFPEMVWEDSNGEMQARWIFRKVKCASCFVQLTLADIGIGAREG